VPNHPRTEQKEPAHMADRAVFTWNGPDGQTITLPLAADIEAGVIRRARNLEPVDAMFTLLEGSVDGDTLAAIDRLKVRDLNAMFEAWQVAVEPNGGVTLPES
jgi:hypothetical protein